MLFGRLEYCGLKGLVLAAGIAAAGAGGAGVVDSSAAGFAVPTVADRAVVPVQAGEKAAGSDQKAEKKQTAKPKSAVKVRRFTPCGPGASTDGCKPSN